MKQEVEAQQMTYCQPSGAPLKAPSGVLKQALVEHLELLLGRLRGEALIVAMLSYGLGVRVSQIREARVRDVSLSDRTIVLGGKERVIPATLFDDIQDHVHDRVRESDRRCPLAKRDQRLFTERSFESLLEESRHIDRLFSEKWKLSEGSRARACFDSRLRILGWFHKKCAGLRGQAPLSALELMDKGPRIVRRSSAGIVDAYYVWRASRILSI